MSNISRIAPFEGFVAYFKRTYHAIRFLASQHKEPLKKHFSILTYQ